MKPSSQFLTGLAWTLLIVAGWACLRLGLWLAVSIADAGKGDGAPLLGIEAPLSQFLAGLHIAIAGFTVFAAMALPKRRAWSRKYFMGLMGLVAVEAVAFGLWFMFQGAGEGEVQGLQWATGVPVVLLGLIAGLVGLKLGRDVRIRGEFV